MKTKLCFILFLMVASVIRLMGAATGYATVLYEEDFELDVPGTVPASITRIGGDFPNVVSVVDDTMSVYVATALTEFDNPLFAEHGQSVLVYDWGSLTFVRMDVELADPGRNFSNLRIEFDFQRIYESDPEDMDDRIDWGIGATGAGINSMANRPFDLRILNNGKIVTKNIDLPDSDVVGTYDTSEGASNKMIILINTQNENALPYDFPDEGDIGSGTISTNSYQLFLNGVFLGEWGIIDQLNFYTESNVLGKMAFFQDTNRKGGIVFDNIVAGTIFDPIAPVVNGISTTTPSVVAGDTARIFVDASGRETLEFQWYEGESGDTSSPITSESALTNTLIMPGIDSERTFWAQVTNDFGVDDSASITISTHVVRDPVSVTNQAELEALLFEGLIAGDIITIPNGDYANWAIDFHGAGTEQHPVILQAENSGYVRLSGSSRLNIGGTYVEVYGLVFSGDYSGEENEIVQFKSAAGMLAHHSRLSDCAIIDYNTDAFKNFWVNIYGTYNRVDHCYFSGLDSEGLIITAWLDNEPDYHRIDHNHFANRAWGGGENGWETVRLGTSSESLFDASITVEDNFFERCDGEHETISNKSCFNIFRNNTFFECAGSICLRHGDNCLVDSNVFIGNGSLAHGGTGGVRIMGRNHVVINNYFEGITTSHEGVITVEAGIPDSPLAGYYAADNATVAFNTVVNSPLVPLINMSRRLNYEHVVDSIVYYRTDQPENVTIANNLFYGDSDSGVVWSGDDHESNLWEGNIAFGSDTNDKAGISLLDPSLTYDNLARLFRPSSTSVVIDAAEGDYTTLLTADMDGETRSGTYDVGADEVSTNGLTYHSAATTGPTWLGADRVLYDSPLAGYFGADLVDEGSGLYSTAWFGQFWGGSFPWIYHVDNGWLYAIGSGDNLYFYDGFLGWVYSNPTAYPWVYDFGRGSWVYILPGYSNPRWLYVYNDSLWINDGDI